MWCRSKRCSAVLQASCCSRPRGVRLEPGDVGREQGPRGPAGAGRGRYPGRHSGAGGFSMARAAEELLLMVAQREGARGLLERCSWCLGSVFGGCP